MSFISSDEAIRRLKSPSNLANLLSVQRPGKIETILPSSRPPAAPPVSTEVKALSNVLSKLDGADAAASALGLTPAQVRASSRSKNPEVIKKTSATIERVRDLALDRLMDSLGLLDIDSLRAEPARNISAIAANMSKIVHNLAPSDVAASERRTLVIYAPNQREQKDFSVIDI